MACSGNYDASEHLATLPSAVQASFLPLDNISHAGGLILASPLPDELGVAVLGFSKMRLKYFALLSFVFNFLGIAVIGLVARALAG